MSFCCSLILVSFIPCTFLCRDYRDTGQGLQIAGPPGTQLVAVQVCDGDVSQQLSGRVESFRRKSIVRTLTQSLKSGKRSPNDALAVAARATTTAALNALLRRCMLVYLACFEDPWNADDGTACCLANSC